MKHGNIVDPETAKRIVDEIRANVFANGRANDFLFQLRPVIWPEALAQEALQEGIKGNAFISPQRQLAHLVCQPEGMHVYVHMPQYVFKTGEFGSMMTMEYFADYYGNVTHEKLPVIFTYGDEITERLEHLYKLAATSLKRKVREHRIINLKTALREAVATNKPDDRLIPFFQCAALEAFAFSSYAVTRPRPTNKQAINPNPKKKGWPAIEVVSLRLPEKRPPSAPTGRKIDLRFPVKEHMRRQPTKEGIKLITIAEHWRGPKNAPIKPKTQKVYKVVK